MLGASNEGLGGRGETTHPSRLNSRSIVVRILDVELTLAFIDLLEFVS